MMTFRCGLVAYGLDRPVSGIARYTLHLAKALRHLDDQVELVWLSAGRSSSPAKPAGATGFVLPGCGRLPGLVLVGSLVMPCAADQLALHVVHDPTGAVPLLLGAGRARTIVTVHDVVAWSCPGHSTLADTLLYRYWLPRALPRVDAVITDSRASWEDIVRYLRPPAQKVTVVYPGVSATYSPVSLAQASAVAARYGLRPGYILFVGSVEERKNLSRLLQACHRLWKAGEQRPLVVVGPHKWKYRRILQTVEELGISKRVIFTGYIPDEDLPALEVLLRPSAIASLCHSVWRQW